MNDLVLIEGLAVETVIGVFDWEREIQQRLIIDLELHTDITKAASTDDLQDTLDYKAISDAAIAFVANTEYQLVEALAEDMAAMILAEFSVQKLGLKISKPGAVPQADNVAIKILRSAD